MHHTPKPPQPLIQERLCDADILEAASASEWSAPAARVIASRLGDTLDALSLIQPSPKALDHPDGLPDIDRAASRIADAIEGDAIIGINTDHDVDGLTAHAVIVQSLIRFGVPRERLHSYVGHRLKEGYGLSQPLAQRILSQPVLPDLLITADHGSSDEPRIAQFADRGIDVIVTDHHDLPVSGIPKSAFACITPRRDDCDYPDGTIAGCMVAWLLMCKVRMTLMERGHRTGTARTLSDLLDYVALGTVADCVDLGHSYNNRIVVQLGLPMIARQQRPCWKMAYANGWVSEPLAASSLAFGIGPRINAYSRLEDAMAGLDWLLAGDTVEAVRYGEKLDEQNRQRKVVERELKETAFQIADRQVGDGRKSVVAWLENGHAGVQGIVASRITEAYGRPSICLSPKVGDPGLVVGSARGIDGVHIRQALQSCYDTHPGVFVKFGGHPAAGGLTIHQSGLETFSRDFEQAIRAQLVDGRRMGPVIHTDGPIQAVAITRELVEELALMEPFGRGFETPVFELILQVTGAQPMGDGSHWRLRLQEGGHTVNAVWFFATEPGAQEPPLALGATARFCVSASLSTFRGEVRLDVKVHHAEPVKARAVA